MTTMTETMHKSKWLLFFVWMAQIALIGIFGMTGVMKAFTPIAELSKSIAWTGDVPVALVRFIGYAEIAGALGLILPPIFRFLPGYLTPLASVGLMTIMILAMGFHSMRGEFQMLPLNVTLAALGLFVAWGRFKKYPLHH